MADWEGKLVRDEGITLDKVFLIAEIAVGLRAVGEIKEGFQVVPLLVVDGGELPPPALVLVQQPFADHLLDVGAGQLHARPETSLDFGKVIGLLLACIAKDEVHILLSGDDDPGPAPALGRQALGHRLQVGH